MQVHYSLPEQRVLDACALTVGTFDGVHRGHQLLVQRLKTEAAQRDLPAAVLTFLDMPICHFRPDICPRLLTLGDEKVAAFAETPLDHLFIVPFNEQIARQSAAEFMAYWRKIAGIKLFVGGPDFALGRDRQGDIPALRAVGAEQGFEVLALEHKLLEGETPISSTRSRVMVESGDMAAAKRCLGHYYSLQGEVVGGQMLGRTIGVPTINLRAHERKCLPANGVYAVLARLDGAGELLPAALNLGFRPTVDGVHLAMEFHVLDRDIAEAPQRAELIFVERLRDERKFAGLPALVEQLHLDIARARDVLGNEFDHYL